MYTFHELAAQLSGTWLYNAKPGEAIAHLSVDTRQMQQANGTLFLAISGAHTDGHRYLKTAFDKGCRNFLVEKAPDEWLGEADMAKCNILRVPQTIQALQQLAAFHRSHFDLPVIGITGSNGKTMVKEWLYQLLYHDWRIVKSPRSYNSQIGVPLSVWQIRPEHELGIFEAGISQPGEMANLAPLIQPTIGVFTNLGEAHQANFRTYTEKALEKLGLFRDVQHLVYPAGYPALDAAIESQKKAGYFRKPSMTVWDWHYQDDGASATYSFSKAEAEQNLNLIDNSYGITLTLPFVDKGSVENAANCWLSTRVLGYQPDALQERFRHLSAVAMRLELKKGINHSTLINDAYNADLASLRIALDELHRQKQHSGRTLILSDLLESSLDEESLYEAVGELLAAQGLNRIIGIGAALQRQKHALPSIATVYTHTSDFLNVLPEFHFSDEAILLKGARSFEFERISRKLEQASHRTIMEINLSALAQNLNAYRRQLKPGVRTMVMVKAFSYGSGTYEVANLLAHHRVDYLAVAYADEGVALRKAGIDLPIMVLNPEARAFPDILAYQLEPEIYSLSHLQQLQETLAQNPPSQPLPIHLMLDTGMHRLGVEEADLAVFLQAFQQSRYLKLGSVFSHLAASDDPTEDAFTKAQISLFEEMAQAVQSTVPYPVPRHILNTNGVLRFPEAQYEMVRLGIGFYGVDRTGLLDDELAIPASLITQISQIKQLKPGATVGYGRKGEIRHPTTIATLAIGYADGFSRLLSNGRGYVLIQGYKAPVIGDVCMDMTMVDVTGIPAREGDQAVIFGKAPTIEELARLSYTIPYEILTSVSQRVKRVYYQD